MSTWTYNANWLGAFGIQPGLIGNLFTSSSNVRCGRISRSFNFLDRKFCCKAVIGTFRFGHDCDFAVLQCRHYSDTCCISKSGDSARSSTCARHWPEYWNRCNCSTGSHRCKCECKTNCCCACLVKCRECNFSILYFGSFVFMAVSTTVFFIWLGSCGHCGSLSYSLQCIWCLIFYAIDSPL